MGIIQTGRVEIAYEASGSGEAGVVILIRGQGTQLIHWPKSFHGAFSAQGFGRSDLTTGIPASPENLITLPAKNSKQ